MSDNNLEHDPTAGAGSEPTSQASGGGGTLTSEDLTALLNTLAPVIDEKIARATQSQKDRRIGKLESNMSDVLARFKDLVLNQKVNPDFAEWMLGVEGALNQNQASLNVASPIPPGGTERKAERSAQEVSDDLELFGLNANDPAVIDIVRRGGERDALVELAKARKKAPPPNPAAATPTSGGTSHTQSLIEIEKQIATFSAKNDWSRADYAEYDRLVAERRKLSEE